MDFKLNKSFLYIKNKQKRIGKHIRIALILNEIDIKIRLTNKIKFKLFLFFSHTKNTITKHDSLKKLVLPKVNHCIKTGADNIIKITILLVCLFKHNKV